MSVRKIIATLSVFAINSSGSVSLGASVFVYDQQSYTNESAFQIGDGARMQAFPSPWGQSFTPALRDIHFIRLNFADDNASDGLGATVFLTLRSNSVSGPIVGSTLPTTMSSLFTGTTNFFFPTPVTVTPGVTYFFEPMIQSGGSWGIIEGEYFYGGGSFYANGLPNYGIDLWFREGVVVPIISVERTNGKPLLRFSTFSNQNYLVEYSPDLNSGSWTNLLDINIQGDGSEVALVDTNATPALNRFYRLKLVP